MEKFIQVKSLPEATATQLASVLELPLPLVRLLVMRGYTTREEIVSFLKPSFSDVHDPFLMRDMEKAVDRVLGAVDRGELITLWGDYDVDGVTATALLHRTLSKLGARLRIHIPHRKKEGYGLSEGGIVQTSEEGSSLIVTTDCGVTSTKAAELAAHYGVDLIVTDHHLSSTSLPNAVAILDPKIEGENYPFRDLAGVGIAFKLAHALCVKKTLPVEWLKDQLDLVALGTIADLVPLVGENRVFSRIGLKKLNRTKNVGLKALIEVSGLSDKLISTYAVLFQLGPRLNAAGRMAEGRSAVEMLISEDETEAAEFSRRLDGFNMERRAVEDSILSDAVWMVEEAGLGKEPILVLAKDGWHPGVIGICASRIVEKYWRPAVLVALDGEEGKGSARSIPSFHIYDALSQCGDYLIDFGGHACAAGLRIERGNVDRFRERMKEVASATLTEEDYIRKTIVDLELSFSEIDERFSKLLRLFAPFGPCNPVPLFLTRNIEAVGTPKIVGGNHLKVALRHDGKVLSAIGFSQGEFLPQIEIALPNLAIVYSVGEDEFAGVRRLVLNVKRMWQSENRGDPI